MTRVRRNEMHRRERRVAFGMALLTLALVALAGLAIYLYDANERHATAIEELRIESQKRGDSIAALSADSKNLREKLAREGVNPNTVAPPPEKRIDAPPTVIQNTIIERPSDDQVRSAVAAVLAENPSLTQAQVAAAVTAYLKANPPKDGADGKDGADAPEPSQEQVDAAVAAYCADNNCDGPAGEPGAPGPAGEPGEDAFPFEFHFQLPDNGPLAGAAYTCVIVDPATPALCTQDGSG